MSVDRLTARALARPDSAEELTTNALRAFVVRASARFGSAEALTANVDTGAAAHSYPLKSHHLARAFTLAELLAVVAIISVLAAILLPILARARSRALREQCMSNMSQLAKACHSYTQDWDGMYPPVLAASCPPSLKCWTWHDAVLPYVRSKQTFLCPTNPIGWEYDRLQLGPDPLSDFAVFISGRFPVSYEMSFGTRDGEIMISVPRIDSEVHSPSSWIMLMETRGTPGADPWDLAESVVLKDEGRALWAVHGHGRGANWAFFDGRVRWLPFEKTIEPQWLWGDFEMSPRWRQALIDRVLTRKEPD